MRRSALVNVPAFSRNDDAGRITSANLVVSFSKISWHTRKSSDFSAAYDVVGVGVGLGNVLAEDVHRLEPAVDRRVEHLRDGEALVARQIDAPRAPRTPARHPRRRPSGMPCRCRAARPCPMSPEHCSVRAAAAAPSRVCRPCRSSSPRCRSAAPTSEPYLCSVTPRPQTNDASVGFCA